MSHITHGEKGFRMTFDNGYTLSVQYGLGNYCERRDYSKFEEPKDPNTIESSTCEIAVWDTDKKWVKLSAHDDVAGWISVDLLPEIMSLVRSSSLNKLCTLIAA